MNANTRPIAAADPLVEERPARGELDAFWMPFTANRQFKANPRLLARADGMHYWTPDGRQLLDAVAGLWCVNAGHGRPEIAEAVARQLSTMEFAPTFQMGHPLAFELANRLAEIAPPGMDRIFFTNSGSESVDTALKIAIAYRAGHAARPRAPASSAAKRAITAWALAACRLAAWSTTANSSAHRCCLVWTICRIPWTSDTTPSRAAFPGGECISPMNWSAWLPCMTPPPSRR